MPSWFHDAVEKSSYFMPHGHCYLWIPWLLWLHVISDLLIGAAYIGIALILWMLVRKIRLPFSPVFVAFGLFISLCGATHFMEIWNVWNSNFIAAGVLKAATAAASVVTAVGLFYVRPQVEEVVHAAKLSEERRIRLESTNAELEAMVAKVKALDEIKTRFFANVSHDLRTPLALILGPVDKMLADDSLTSAQRRQLQSINANGSMLLKQVNDLLDLSRIESGTVRPRYVQLDMAAWLRRVTSRFEVAAEQRGIRFHVEAPDQMTAQVDPAKLERVITNLLGNALKVTPRDGSILVRLAEEDAQLRIDVRDSGPGIPVDQREAIFDRFRQVDGSELVQQRGTGLGLAIVREFVQLHAGRVEVADQDSGASFCVRLPRWAPPGVPMNDADVVDDAAINALKGSLHELDVRAPGSAGGNLPSIPGRPQVLLVEDNPQLQDFIAESLACRFNVSVASDGHEGLAHARALVPDLVITDIMMPRMSGDELVAELRKDAAFDTVPVLLLTAKADDELRVRLLEQGAQDYLHKPFLTPELLARASNLIDAKRAGDTLRGAVASASADITELARQIVARNRQLQVALEGAQVAREQAEQATKVKSYFLGMISHELRSPLSTMHLNLQMLMRDQRSAVPEAMKPKIERLVRATQQMASLVEGLLGYTRAESGKLDATFAMLDPAAVIASVIDEQAESVPPGVLLSFDPPTTAVEALSTDGRLLRVVLTNLVSNALKFTSQGSVTVTLDAGAGSHVIEVRDTGPGIPEADLVRIFQPFEQLEPLKRKAIPGVGLGLALVRQLVQALNGEIAVSSAVGAGTTFRLSLPSSQLGEK